jgi:hypothetical protein
VAADCQSGVCDPTQLTCTAPNCTDTAINGKETDLNCGGGDCPTCLPGGACLVAGDCESSVCSGNPLKCQAPACNDNVKNGDETDKDCGGSCAPAKKCADMLVCAANSDCQSGVCDTTVSHTCQSVSCGDSVKNGTETGVDCGGSCAPLKKCDDGLGCGVAGDCKSGVCSTTCQVPSCTDNVKNGTEAAIDCDGVSGGVPCPACVWPGTPTGLIVDNTTSKFKMTISWNAGDAATQSWKLDWTINGVAANAAPIVLPVATTSYVLAELNVNSTYVFTLKGSNAVGDGPTVSSGAAASFAIPGHSPGNGFKEARIEPNGWLHFSWYVGTAGDAVGATSYTAYVGATSDRSLAAPHDTQVPAAGKVEYYWISDGFLVSTPRYLWGSATKTGEGTLFWPFTLNPGPDMAGAITFTNVSDTSVKLDWPAAAGAAGYRCRWTTSTIAPIDNDHAALVATNSCTITNLLSGTAYHFWVESTGAAMSNGVASVDGLPGAVTITAAHSTTGTTYVPIATAGLPALHNTTFGIVTGHPAEVAPGTVGPPPTVWADTRAWDGDTGTQWGYNDGKFTVAGGLITQFGTAPVNPPWVAVDLGMTPPVVSLVTILWQNACTYVWRIDGSNDLGTWTPILDVCKVGGTCGTPIATVAGTPMRFALTNSTAYRYIRLIMPSNVATDYYNTAYGVKFFDISLMRLP